jgi:5-bromo-4-chloroindolyl phosphate hydrolysis protein
VIITFATFFTSYFSANNDLFLSILLALISFIGFYFYYGLDPKIDKVGDLNFGVNAEDVINITKSAEKKVQNLKTLQKNISDNTINSLLDNIIDQTTHIIKSIQENPNDLSRARKFFNIYLDRTCEITDDYVANLKKEIIDDKIKENYIVLLKSVKETIKEQKQRLNEDDITKLDIQIEALTKQIKNEGV